MKLQKKPEHQYIYTAGEVGERTGLSPDSLRNYRTRYRIGSKPGRDIMYSEHCIEVILFHMRRGPGKPKKEQA